MNTIKILWPRKEWLTEEQIRSMYADALANKQVAPADTVQEMAEELDSAGIITLGAS